MENILESESKNEFIERVLITDNRFNNFQRLGDTC